MGLSLSRGLSVVRNPAGTGLGHTSFQSITISRDKALRALFEDRVDFALQTAQIIRDDIRQRHIIVTGRLLRNIQVRRTAVRQTIKIESLAPYSGYVDEWYENNRGRGFFVQTIEREINRYFGGTSSTFTGITYPGTARTVHRGKRKKLVPIRS